jgi:hypothetical protein
MIYPRTVPLALAIATLIALTAATGALAADEAPQLTPRAAVFPFADPVEQPDRMIGRRASDAAWAALTEQAPWELVDPTWLLRLCEAENARAPFAVGYLQMLGQRASAPLAVTGSIEECAINFKRGVAQVTVGMHLVETLGGVKLASGRGVASAKREDGEVLGQAIDRALIEACGDASRELTSFDPLTAVVVTALPDGRVMMDGPREPRIKPGAKMLVFRGDELIGAVEVKTSRVTVLHAQPISGEDFVQGDRAVFVAR